ncbi:MAG: DegT/DnrJ/EryC1/StrS family aminotransferase [Thermodesulfobacteriota bacterium]
MERLALSGGRPVRTRPFPLWPQAGPEETRYLDRVLKGNRWFAGARGDDPDSLGCLFGSRFAELHNAAFGFPVANGSVAIEIALRAVGIEPGDEVIVPAYTFVSTATSVIMVGGIPVFADIDPRTYCLSPDDLLHRIGPRTRAIIPVHLGGHMANMESIVALAREKDLFVVEDCAQAIGAGIGARKAGTWGHLGTFSFQSNKTVTSGEGGLVLADDPELAGRVVAFRAFGRASGGPLERSSSLSSRWLSSNYRLSELQAAVLLAQLERFPVQDERRQANAGYLTSGLRRIPGIEHVRHDLPGMKHGYYYYLVRYEPESFKGLSPERLCRTLNAEGIPFLPGDQEPIYRNPVFEVDNLRRFVSGDILKRYRESIDPAGFRCPAAEDACGRTLLLRHQVLLAEREDMDDISEALWKVRKNLDQLL